LVCKTCQIEKSVIEFHKQKSNKTGFQIYCKSCKKELAKKYRSERVNRIITCTELFCCDCDTNKAVENFNKNPLSKTGFEKRCKSCQSIYCKNYVKINKKELKQKSKVYYLKNKNIICAKVKNYRTDESNREKIRIKSNNYVKTRYKNDPIYNLISRLRSNLRICLKRNNWKKNTRTLQIAGCSGKQLKEHIEDQFKPGMSWNNSNLWEIDHIYPTSLATSEKEVYELFHWSNLQPLWALENKQKSNKVVL
jgi:hypothetical protein